MTDKIHREILLVLSANYQRKITFKEAVNFWLKLSMAFCFDLASEQIVYDCRGKSSQKTKTVNFIRDEIFLKLVKHNILLQYTSPQSAYSTLILNFVFSTTEPIGEIVSELEIGRSSRKVVSRGTHS